MEASGRGCFYAEAEEGQVLFSTRLEDGQLDIYMGGFAFGKDKLMSRVFFADVSSIDSHLNAELFSNAGRSGDLDFYVPLDIRHASSSISLSVPFLSYSNVINILVEFREEWMKQATRSDYDF